MNVTATPGSLQLEVHVTTPTQERAIQVAQVYNVQTPETLTKSFGATIIATEPVFIIRTLRVVQSSAGLSATPLGGGLCTYTLCTCTLFICTLYVMTLL